MCPEEGNGPEEGSTRCYKDLLRELGVFCLGKRRLGGGGSLSLSQVLERTKENGLRLCRGSLVWILGKIASVKGL